MKLVVLSGNHIKYEVVFNKCLTKAKYLPFNLSGISAMLPAKHFPICFLNGLSNQLISPNTAEIVTNVQNSSTEVSSCDTNNVYERIRLEKLAFVHRAVNVTTDPNGCNFAVLQSDPKTRYSSAIYENNREIYGNNLPFWE